MGLFKILRIGKAIGDLYSTDKQLEALQKAYRQQNKKFRKHVENCADLQRYPEATCLECEKVASKTGSWSALYGIRNEIRQRNTPALMEVFTEDAIIEAALSKWSEDPSRKEPNGRPRLGNKDHDSLTVYISWDGGGGSIGSGSVKVSMTGWSKEEGLSAEEPYIQPNRSDMKRIIEKATGKPQNW